MIYIKTFANENWIPAYPEIDMNHWFTKKHENIPC